MKTPMQEMFYRIEQLRFAKNPIDELMMIRLQMLEKEKEVMCQFADEFAIECINFHHEKTMSQEQFFNLTFNTKEK